MTNSGIAPNHWNFLWNVSLNHIFEIFVWIFRTILSFCFDLLQDVHTPPHACITNEREKTEKHMADKTHSAEHMFQQHICLLHWLSFLGSIQDDVNAVEELGWELKLLMIFFFSVVQSTESWGGTSWSIMSGCLSRVRRGMCANMNGRSLVRKGNDLKVILNFSLPTLLYAPRSSRNRKQIWRSERGEKYQ